MKRLKLPKEKMFLGPAMVWKRIVAFLIDIMLINLVVFFPFRSLFQSIVPNGYSLPQAYRFLSSSTNYTGFITSVSVVMSILMILYFMMLEKRTGQTIGKALMKIYVISDNSLKTWQLLVRNLVFIPIFPFILLWILDPLFIVFSKTGQRLSEILSRTRVVEKYSMEQ